MGTLWNPTNEVLSYGHAKIVYTLQPGEIKKNVPERAVNHLITKLKNRGLIALTFEDAEKPELKEVKKKAALAAQNKFEMTQIQNFNRINQKNEMQKKAYIEPEEHLRRFALRWGVELNEPYTIKDVEKEGIANAEKRAIEAETETKELRQQLDKVTNTVEQLVRGTMIKERLYKLDKRTAEYKKITDLIEASQFAEAEEQLTSLGV